MYVPWIDRFANPRPRGGHASDCTRQRWRCHDEPRRAAATAYEIFVQDRPVANEDDRLACPWRRPGACPGRGRGIWRDRSRGIQPFAPAFERALWIAHAGRFELDQAPGVKQPG